MSLGSGFKSEVFKNNVTDWITAIGLILYFGLVAEQAKPFYREFSLSDPSIQHPFADVERVTGVQCVLVGFFIPLVVIFATTFYLKSKLNRSNKEHLNMLQVSILGLVLTLSIDGVITDILKNWIARPRPDFLARCGAKKGTPLNTMVNIHVCTAPLGNNLLIDGMRSTPSGHSSISFACMLYLTLWLVGQFKIARRTTPIYRYLISGLPLLLAFYIALSRTQDYRHHFSDIVIGGILGCTIAVAIYHKFFYTMFHKNCDKVYVEENDTLPL